MSYFAIYALVWPVVGTILVISFVMFLARRDLAAYNRSQAEAVPPQIQDAARAANQQFIADALKKLAEDSRKNLANAP